MVKGLMLWFFGGFWGDGAFGRGSGLSWLGEKQIPGGNDRKKSKGKSKGKGVRCGHRLRAGYLPDSSCHKLLCNLVPIATLPVFPTKGD